MKKAKVDANKTENYELEAMFGFECKDQAEKQSKWRAESEATITLDQKVLYRVLDKGLSKTDGSHVSLAWLKG